MNLPLHHGLADPLPPERLLPERPPSDRRRGRPSAAAARTAEDTRLDILTAAASLFREKGYKATTLRDIAELLRMSPANMYYYFPSKDTILQEVVSRGFDAIETAVREGVGHLPASAKAVERLPAAIAANLRSLLVTGDCTTAYARIYNQLPNTFKRRDNPRRIELHGLYAGLVKQAQTDGDIRADVTADMWVEFAMGSLGRCCEWFDPERVSPEDLSNRVADWLLQGVR